jgi:hypothetical protein
MKAAFDMQDPSSLRDCFALTPTLADLAVSYASGWSQELGTDVEV